MAQPRPREIRYGFRLGGEEHIQYRFRQGTSFPGVALTNDGSYHDIVTNQRVLTASTMALAGRRKLFDQLDSELAR